jgi:hypothetical protein
MSEFQRKDSIQVQDRKIVIRPKLAKTYLAARST